VPSMADYGRLSKRPLDEMIAGARVEVAPYKRDAMDFVLWKPSKPGEPAWPSPAGIKTPGRPGWHIECSAMADKWLWTEALSKLSESGRAHPHQFDIHGGGIDLLFPHHEDEIAQSRCAFHTPALANYWLHNGFLQVEGEKMSKSLGNFVTIREVLRSRSGEAIRLNMLMTHYRQPINWTQERLREAEIKIDNWYRSIPDHVQESMPDPAVKAALEDDLNTWVAIQRLEELYHDLKREPFEPVQKKLLKYSTFKASANLLGLLYRDFKSWHDELVSRQTKFELTWDESLKEQVDSLVQARNEARNGKNFKEADRIRDELAKMGVVLKDTKDGTTWEIAR
jgi:cysteinyl-tRNA synthetase